MTKYILTIGLAVFLSACGLFNTQPEDELPNISQIQNTPIPNPIMSSLVSAVTPTHASLTTPKTPITVQFTQPQIPATIGRAFSLLTGTYTTTPTTKLGLTSMCNGRWRVRNPNSSHVIFTWDIYNPAGNNREEGNGIVPAGSDVYFTTKNGQKTARVFVENQQHNVKAANLTPCNGAIPNTTNAIAGTFDWNNTNTKVVFTPSTPLQASQTYTVSIALPTPQATAFIVQAGLSIGSVQPISLTNNANATLTIQGSGFTTNTSFFIQSTKLSNVSVTNTEAKVTVPAGFPPSNYGIMAANPDGTRATIYPGFQIIAGPEAKKLDPLANADNYIQGYVIDYVSKAGIAGAEISIPGLKTTSDQDGFYSLRGVPFGKHAVEIEAVGYETLYRNAEITTQETSQQLKLAALEPITYNTSYIGSTGGIHYATDAGINGPHLKILAGALADTTSIQFTHLRAPETLPELPDDGYYLAFAHLGPTGLVFKKPATLYLPLQENIAVAEGTPINILYFNTLENKWVDDLTSGVISRINGKLFLEYEINHFTWIGGVWFPNPVQGCVKYADGQPAKSITTNFGITDANGNFYGSTTASDIDRDIVATVIPAGTAPPQSKRYTGRERGLIQIPCITLPEAIGDQYVLPPTPDQIEDNDIAPFNLISITPIDGKRLIILKENIKSFSTSGKLPCITRQTAYGSQNKTCETIIPTSCRFELTSYQSNYTYSGKMVECTSNGYDGTFQATAKLTSAPKAAAYFLRFYATTSAGKLVSNTRRVDIPAQLWTPHITVSVAPDAFFTANNLSSPRVRTAVQGSTYMFKRSDVNNGRVTIEVPIQAVDEMGRTITLITGSDAPMMELRGEERRGRGVDDIITGRGQFNNGVSKVPIFVHIPDTNATSAVQYTMQILKTAQVDANTELSPLSEITTANSTILTQNKLSLRPLYESGIAPHPDLKQPDCQFCVATEKPVKPYQHEITKQFEYIELEQPIPTVATRSQTFWGNIGDWFNKSIPATIEFAIGMIPIVGTGIDCVKGAFHLATNQDVDLFETELGCIGMSFDALVTAATLAGQLQVTATYPILKPVMFAMKQVNLVSIRFSGAARTALIKTVERLGLARSIAAYRDEAVKLMTRISNAKFTKGVIDEGVETGGKKLDDTMKDILESCGLPFSRQGVRPLAVQCGLNADDYWDLTNKAGNSMEEALRNIDADLGRPPRPLITTSTQLVIQSWIQKYRLHASRLSSSLGFTDAEEFGLKQLENFGKAIDPKLVASGTYTEWISPAGIKFGLDTGANGDGTRVLHVLLRHGKNSTELNKSKFLFEDFQIFDVIDEAYTRGLSGNPSPIFNPARPNNMCIDLGRIIGQDRNGNPVTGVLFGLVQPNASPIPAIPEIRTVFPSVC